VDRREVIRNAPIHARDRFSKADIGDNRDMKRPTAPKGLQAQGRALWASVTRVYELSPAELATLAQAARVVDLLGRIDGELAAADMTVEGSMGQLRPHPLLQASGDQRRTLDGLLRSLNLPMPGEDEGRRRSPAAVQAAQARWRAERGRDGQMA
jgi:hypothetical protein